MSGNGDALPPERDAAEIRASLAAARRQIATSFVALREEASLALSWREWYRRNTGLFLGAAFCIGFLAAGKHRR